MTIVQGECGLLKVVNVWDAGRSRDHDPDFYGGRIASEISRNIKHLEESFTETAKSGLGGGGVDHCYD